MAYAYDVFDYIPTGLHADSSFWPRGIEADSVATNLLVVDNTMRSCTAGFDQNSATIIRAADNGMM